jgi:two-component system CheB/CheR fusion protein
MAARNKKSSPAPAKESIPPDFAESSFLIVGIGASAGGLEAVTELLRNIPQDSGCAFVLVQHLDPSHSSMLDQILARATTMPVRQVEDNIQVRPNQVYIIPPNTELDIERGVLRLSARESSGRGMSMPIDHFLRSLARDQGSQAVAVILSGTASDGSLGTKAIKSEGGIVFAQDDSARYDSMPRAAMAAGAVDFVMSPAAIAEELLRIARHSSTRARDASMALAPDDLVEIFQLLRSAHGVDFTHYKPNTIERRIRRRMAIHREGDLAAYVSHLRDNPDELENLYHDLLIRVTGFFRDPEVFESLKISAFPDILSNKVGSDRTVRIWVPGCSTGEEAYSLAISFLELREQENQAISVQVFGTDVSERSISEARAGVFPESIASEMSRERLRKFFIFSEGKYRVTKEVRDCCVFALQNVTRDPPFSRLDLISCRNVMIYLGPALQRKIIAIFHYALIPSGFLLLGSSESIGSFTELFDVVDRKHKVYRKRLNSLPQLVELGPSEMPGNKERPRRPEERVAPSSVFREADHAVLSRYAPPGVVTNDKLEIVQFRGRTSAFLEPAPGTATLELFKMVREGLLSAVRSGLKEAQRTREPVRREGGAVKYNGAIIDVAVEIIPFVSTSKEQFFIVLFEQVDAMEQSSTIKRKGSPKSRKTAPPPDDRQVTRLRHELEATREYLQSIIEEQEAMNQELRFANEEIQSSNEELQSTNEELETAKEELQSSNEELITLNEELENRNSELAVLNNDLQNILGSVDIAILLLDENLRIRRMNSEAQRALKLLAADVGRPITDLKTSLGFDGLDKLVGATIDTLTMQEVEVEDRNGAKFSLRIRPYKTADNRIEGAVLTLIDVTRFQSR